MSGTAWIWVTVAVLSALWLGHVIGRYRGKWAAYFVTRACMPCKAFRVCPTCKSQVGPATIHDL